MLCWQALIYPLTVAAKSSVAQRKDAALRILDNMKEHSLKLVKQAMLVRVHDDERRSTYFDLVLNLFYLRIN